MNPQIIADSLAANIEYGLREGYVPFDDLSKLLLSMAEHQGLGPLQCFFEEHLNLLYSRIKAKHEEEAKTQEASA